MFIAYSKKYNYCIKYHPKSGCSVFRKLFLKLHINELTFDQKRILDSFHNVKDVFKYNNENVFFSLNLVRNPYTRIVSMFTNKICGGKQVNGLNKKLKIKTVTFYNFVKLLYDEYNKNPNILNTDPHLDKQSLNYHKNDIILKLENYKNDIVSSYDNPHTKKLIPQIKYILMKNKHINVSNRKNNKINEFIGLTEFSENFSGPWPEYEMFYNQEIKDMVYHIYKEDFEIFNYQKDVVI